MKASLGLFMGLFLPPCSKWRRICSGQRRLSISWSGSGGADFLCELNLSCANVTAYRQSLWNHSLESESFQRSEREAPCDPLTVMSPRPIAEEIDWSPERLSICIRLDAQDDNADAAAPRQQDDADAAAPRQHLELLLASENLPQAWLDALFGRACSSVERCGCKAGWHRLK